MPKERMQDNAEYQRKRTWSQDERAIDARNNIAKTLYEHEQKMGNSRATYDECLRKATEVAERNEKKRNE